jgi:hypothetical protein
MLAGVRRLDLHYKEYHLHDKDGKPIRTAGKTKKHKPQALSSVTTGTVLRSRADILQSRKRPDEP